ncbi:hypothetical protein D9757_008159 [Collybiopsis confluens]|uniref:CoA-binding domain-containing protein n=1 Tax=Collybiopsis confluens TaxID=2823264 RepID=A0A8H5HDW4_9AGAR|nr:hypothetical protein D9757_008159 [Collybiopsis confluens]
MFSFSQRSSNLFAKSGVIRKFSQSACRRGYEDSIKNLLINRDTKVICQGFTGKAGTFHAQEALDYGTRMVGGVSPKKAGQTHLGLPVFGTVKEAVMETKPDASVIYVPPAIAADAILEAIENEIGLIVCVAEGIPEADQIKVRSFMLSEASQSPVSWAPIALEIGIQPGHIHNPGNIGIVSRSGTLSYESAAQITGVGLGQSICIGIGGDPFPGTQHVEAVKVLLDDPNTEGIVFIGEIGGFMEEEAAEYIFQYNKTQVNPKPIVGFVAGRTAPSGRRAASDKIAALSRAGVIIVDSPSKIGAEMLGAMQERAVNTSTSASAWSGV